MPAWTAFCKISINQSKIIPCFTSILFKWINCSKTVKQAFEKGMSSKKWMQHIKGIPFVPISLGQCQSYGLYRSLSQSPNKYSSGHKMSRFFQVIKLGIPDVQFWRDNAELCSMSRLDVWQFTHLYCYLKHLDYINI